MQYQIKWVVLATLISACSAGTNSDVGTAPTSGAGDSVTYSDLSSINYSLRFFSARLFTEQGATMDPPTSGTAEFAGVASFREATLPPILASAVLQVDFAADSVTGALGGFKAEDGTELDGALTISNGSISRTDSSVIADVDGRLTSTSALLSTVDVTGEFSGALFGDNYTYVRGGTSTTWTTNAGTANEETRAVLGEITVEKQF